MKKGLYIHIPFCKAKCNYCNFYSSTNLDLKKAFFEAINKEIQNKREKFADFFSGCCNATLYIGGGNPAILTNSELEQLFSIANALFPSFEEVTIELNPDDVSMDKLELLKSLGVNRVSLGIQSFCDDVLKFLGRSHDNHISLKVLEYVAEHFDNYSIDLIGGIPSVERDWEREFDFIKQFYPPHISFYLLSIEEGSKFFGNLSINDELQSLEYKNFLSFLAKIGYEHYEVSNFCRNGYYSHHNMLYWEGEDYLGFGPSASSFLKDKAVRFKNCANLEYYIQNPDAFDVEQLTEQDRFLETIFLSLRTAKGTNLSCLKTEFPVFFEKITAPLANLKKAGYLIEKDGNITISEQHWIVMNEIIVNLLKEN